MGSLYNVAVFCGSSLSNAPRIVAMAESLGRTLADRRIGLVYGGGRVGLMGVVADAALTAGGQVFGVIPVGLFSREVAHGQLTKLYEVSSMHERKKLMYDLADGFIALPGGLGTLEELAEVATWAQLGLHQKPVVLLDVDGFWSPLVAQLDQMVDYGLLKPANRSLIASATDVAQALELLAQPLGAGEGVLTSDDR